VQFLLLQRLRAEGPHHQVRLRRQRLHAAEHLADITLFRQLRLQHFEPAFEIGHLGLELRQLRRNRLPAGHALAHLPEFLLFPLQLHARIGGVEIFEAVDGHAGQHAKQQNLAIPRHFVQAQLHSRRYLSSLRCT